MGEGSDAVAAVVSQPKQGDAQREAAEHTSLNAWVCVCQGGQCGGAYLRVREMRNRHPDSPPLCYNCYSPTITKRKLREKRELGREVLI